MNTTSLRGAASIAVVLCLGLITSCTTPSGQNIEPLILSFDYEIQTLASIDGRVRALNGGASITDYMGSNPCKFLADFDDKGDQVLVPLPVPDIDRTGTPGDNGFTMAFVAISPRNIASGGASSCGPVEDFDLQVGGNRSATIQVGGATSNGKFQVTIDGETFDSGGDYFRATLELYRPGTNYFVGNFQFIAQSTSTSGRYIVGEGSYAGR